jgi:ribokinase
VITVIGSANMDLIAHVTALPTPGETVLATHLVALPGGKGANQAVAAARAGSATVLVARLGRDGYGDSLLASLRQSGVDTRFVILDDDEPTGLAMITVDSEGENSIVVVPGANGNLSPRDVDSARDVIEASRVVVLQLEIPLETVAHAIQLAHEAGATVILNPAPAQELDPDFLRQIDILIPNEREVGRLSGMGWPVDPASAAHMLLSAGLPTVVVTLGDQGTVLVTRDEEISVHAYAAQPVDTTGAGDAFVGNFAGAIDRGLEMKEAARFASAAAAWSVQHSGAQLAMPTLEQTETILKGAQT